MAPKDFSGDAGHITEAQYWVGVARRDERARIRRELLEAIESEWSPLFAGTDDIVKAVRMSDLYRVINRIVPEEG